MERAKLENALDFFFGDRGGAEALKAGDERAGEAGEAVAVGEDGFALDCVEGLAHFGGRVLVVVQIADEGGDGALEVDVVFPERIVGIDEQGLAGRKLGHGVMVANHLRWGQLPSAHPRQGRGWHCESGWFDLGGVIPGLKTEVRGSWLGSGFVVSHPCARTKAQGWGTEHLLDGE